MWVSGLIFLLFDLILVFEIDGELVQESIRAFFSLEDVHRLHFESLAGFSIQPEQGALVILVVRVRIVNIEVEDGFPLPVNFDFVFQIDPTVR